MSQTVESLDVAALAHVPTGTGGAGRVSDVGTRLRGSEILRIAAEIRARQAAGEKICNLTVGDFDPKCFRIPKVLEDAVVEALRHGETNYPPSTGIAPLREAVVAFYERALGARYPLESVLITSGSRPGVYGTYCSLVSEGETVIYPVPSWNNNYYCDMVGARGVPIATTVEDAFMPTRAQLEPHVRQARMIALNSPLNPCGTAFTAESLGAISDLVLEENARRSTAERPLFLMYDQVYWQLTFGATQHVDPVTLRPEMARYTVFVDGMSKAFASTGLRVGWVVGPTDIIAVMNNFLGHVGTWAPRAEQVGSATLLGMPVDMAAYRAELSTGVQRRLDLLYSTIMSLRQTGHRVNAIEPMGAIYLSAQFDLLGRTGRDGTRLDSTDAVRRWLLQEAGLAVVPFNAFGTTGDSGWFRLSVGAVSMDDIEAALPRLKAGLESLK